MKKQLTFLICLFLSAQYLIAEITPTALKCEYLTNAAVIDIKTPRLSWKNIATAGERGQLQTAWEIRAASSREALLSSAADLWKSGKIISGESVNIRYNGSPLRSRQDCWWQVRVWDRNGLNDLAYAVFTTGSGNYDFVSSYRK